METEFDKTKVMETFEMLMERLNSLDGLYAWDMEAEIVRKALEIAGYS